MSTLSGDSHDLESPGTLELLNFNYEVSLKVEEIRFRLSGFYNRKQQVLLQYCF